MASNEDRRLTGKEAVRRGLLTEDDLIRARAAGTIERRKKYTSMELEQMVGEHVGPLADLISTPDEIELRGSSEVELVKIRIPGTNVFYVTLKRDGKVILTKDPKTNKLDLSSHHEGMEDLIERFAWASMFDPTRRDFLYRNKGGGKPTPTGEEYRRIRNAVNKDAAGFCQVSDEGMKDIKVRLGASEYDHRVDLIDKANIEKDHKDSLKRHIEMKGEYLKKLIKEYEAKKKRKEAPPKPTRENPGIVRDPIVDIYLSENIQLMAYDALDSTRTPFKKSEVIKGRDNLERVIDDQDFLDKAEALGLELEVESFHSFLAPHSEAIQRRQRKITEELIEDDEIRQIAGAIIDDYLTYFDLVVEIGDSAIELGEKNRVARKIRTALNKDSLPVRYSPFKVSIEEQGGDVYLRIPITEAGYDEVVELVKENAAEALMIEVTKKDRDDDFDPKRTALRALCEREEVIKGFYQRMITARDKLGRNDKGEYYVICLRQTALNRISKAVEDGVIKPPKEDLEKYHRRTRRWKAYAKAADYIKGDKRIRDEVMPVLAASGECDESRINDRIFDALSKIGKLIVDPKQMYNRLKRYHVILEGLWMEGLMDKEVSGGDHVDRTPAGAKVEFGDGVGNYIQRAELYGALLKKSFEEMLGRGDFDEEGLDLDKDPFHFCGKFGRDLYGNLSPEEKAHFAKKNHPDKPLMESQYLTRLLRFGVGILRDEFTDLYQKRSEEIEAKSPVEK